MSTSGVRFARPRRPTAVVDSWARRTSNSSSMRSRACRHVSIGSVSVCGRRLRASTRRTATPPSRLSPLEPLRGASTVTSCPRAASAEQAAAASRADPACRSGNHWSMATRIRTVSQPAFPRRRRAAAPCGPPTCSTWPAPGAGRPRRETRPQAQPRSLRRTPPGPARGSPRAPSRRARELRSRRPPCRRRGTRRP